MSSKKDKKVKLPQPYSEKEREVKMTNIQMQMIQLNIYHFLTDEHKNAIKEFVKNGTEYKTEYLVPVYNRILDIHLINDKKKQTYINVKFNKLEINEKNNKLVELNKLQEGLLNEE